MSGQTSPGSEPAATEPAHTPPAPGQTNAADPEPAGPADLGDLVTGADAGQTAMVVAPAPAPPLRHERSARPVGKVRSPVGCWFLAIVTFGIYVLVWYHHTNKELKEFDPTIEVSPGVAVVALLVPVVGWFSIFNTGQRIRQAQLTAGIPPAVSPGLGVLLTFVFGLYLPYYISQANAVWESAAAS